MSPGRTGSVAGEPADDRPADDRPAIDRPAVDDPHRPVATADVAISAFDLTKRFGDAHALRGISFEVRRGTVFGVIGPNGAGKTTLMRTLLDIIRPSSGTARVLGTDSRSAGPALRRRIGYLPGELALEGRVTGRRLLRQYADISGPVEPGRIDELAGRLNLDLDRSVRTLSKGNKQKLGIVQAFMHRPELLVLDEPTSGLDPLMQQSFLALVHEARDAGQTVFLSSHVISEIQQAADEVAILRDGRIVTVASVDELRASAVRHLRVVVAGTTAAALLSRVSTLAGLTDVRSSETERGVELVGALQNGVAAFIRSVAALDIVDLVIEEPDLEESVLRLYSAPAAATGVAR